MTDEQISELILRRRRQVLVHSILYYRLGESIISDHIFDSWARELAKLQQDNPKLSENIPYMREAFWDYTGETGYYLPLTDERATKVALDILKFDKDQEKE